MPLFGSRDTPRDAATERTSAGELSQHAAERLGELRGGGGKKALFTSDLSVSEFLLVKNAGFTPLGLVVGSSIYHIGIQGSNWSQNQELGVLSQAMYQARELAMTRMEAEAEALGADGIVGVRLDVGRYEWGPSLAEFIAIGTAIKGAAGQSARTGQGRPFTSDLSGQDFFTLTSMGYLPTGMVMGSCVYHVAHQSLGQALKTIGRNAEMNTYSQALYDARELAMQRMQEEAMALGAEGVVGVRIQEQSHGWGSHVIEFFAVGTAVVPQTPNQTIPSPTLMLGLNG